MNEYEVKSATGEPLAILEAADYTDAELFASREIAGAARVVRLPSSEAAETKLRETFQRLGLSESGAKIAVEGRGLQERVDRIRVGHQEAIMPGIAPKRKGMAALGNIHGLGWGGFYESDAKTDDDLAATFQRLGLSESAARVAVRGRERD